MIAALMRRAARGAAAGAVGTFALDAASYLDMLVRGRPPSELPAQAAGQIAERAGLYLGEGDTARNRRTALGALLGYSTGVAVGVGFGLVRGRGRFVPRPVAGTLAGVAAMAAGAAPLTRLGLTDPREWGVSGWVSDIVPHAAYGLATVLAYDALTS